MNSSERFKIISEDFADILVEYNRNLSLFEAFEDYEYNLINEKYAILHIPVSNMDENSIKRFGYSAIPKCYGLTTYKWMEPTDQYTVRSFPDTEFSGKGVLVGFVDTGIDYTNSAFVNADQTTKIKYIWDQSIDSERYPENIFYGTEYSSEEINLALQSDNPLTVVESTDLIGQGTAMACVAAGYHILEKGFSGVATEASIIAVKLKPSKTYIKDFYGIPQDAICYQVNDIMMGIEYLINKAKLLQSPIVICIGVASSQGSHKGEDIFSNYLIETGNRTGVAIVVAAGNEGDQNHHYYGSINLSRDYDIVELKVGLEDKNFSMELWGNLPNLLTVEMYAPNGEMIYQLLPDISGTRNGIANFLDSIIFIDAYVSETYSEEQLVLFRFKNLQEGIWRFRISGTSDLTSSFHIWLPITGFISSETFFLRPDPNTTLSIPGNAVNTITIASYDPVQSVIDPSSGRGFTSINLPKPDVTAPGVNILVPTIDDSFETLSGTSLAAAYAAGVTVGLLEWGIIRGFFPSMNSVIARYFLTNSAIRSPDRIYPNPIWGFGRIE